MLLGGHDSNYLLRWSSLAQQRSASPQDTSSTTACILYLAKQNVASDMPCYALLAIEGISPSLIKSLEAEPW